MRSLLPAHRYVEIFAAIGTLIICALPVSAVGQAASPDCTTHTATNATVILPGSLDVFIDGSRHTGQLRFTVFTDDTECVGSTVWQGAPVALTVWGQAPDTMVTSITEEGIAPGDSLRFRLVNPVTNTAYSRSNSQITTSFRSNKAYLVATPRYVPDGIYVLDEVRVRSLLGSASPDAP